MKNCFLFILALIIASPLAAQQKESSQLKLNSAVDSACYAIGILNGVSLRENIKTFPGGEYNLFALAEGFVQSLIGDLESLLMNPSNAQMYFQNFMSSIAEKEAEAAIAEEKRFLDENKTKAGVITTESGLQYKVLKPGEGDKPAREDRVTVHYTGKLMDGTVFDSSEERGEPITLGVGQFINGWTELLQLMPLGSRYQAWIPSALAYGAQGAGQVIKPYTPLIFEVELLGIEVVESDE